MICEPLPATGVDSSSTLLLLGVAGACLVAGLVLLVVSRVRGGSAATAVLCGLVVGPVLLLTPAPPARAGAPDCVTGENSLTVVQTSTMAGLAPGVDPVPITGVVINNGTDSTHLAAVLVEVVDVSVPVGTPSGPCDTDDYLLLDPLMTVDQLLAPGGSSAFHGASIGFRNSLDNQDSCKGATLHLRYTANPGGSGTAAGS